MRIDLSEALAQIAAMRNVRRKKLYRGYRAMAIAYTGLWALCGSGMQVFGSPYSLLIDPVRFWVGIAIACVIPVSLVMVRDYYRHSGPEVQRDTREVVGQFLPCLVGGFVITLTLSPVGAIQPFFPGLWAICFSLGIFASRPYLPKDVGQAAYFYFVTGWLLLWIGRSNNIIPFLAMGPVFACGQFYTAWVLYWNLERVENAE